MSKGKKDYTKGIIYKIYCKNSDIKDVYIGETTDFTRRKQQHKQISYRKNRLYNTKTEILYEAINNNGGWDNWVIEKIEDYPCHSYDELLARESFWIMELEATLNMKIGRRDNKEYKKEWYMQRRNYILERQRQYREAIKNLYTLDLENLENNPQWFKNNILSSEKIEMKKQKGLGIY